MKHALLKLFRKRWFALLLCVVCVIASTLLNTRVGLGGKSDDLIESFYDSELGEQCIGTQLANLCKATTGLTAIAGHYNLDSTAATLASEQLDGALQSAYGKAQILFKDYKALLEAADELIGRLGLANISKRDAESLALYTTTIDDARSAIDSSGYNDAVRDFLRVNSRFPAGGLAAFAGVRMPELFQ